MLSGRCWVCSTREEVPFFWFTPEMRADADVSRSAFADAHAACRRTVLEEDLGVEQLKCRCVDCVSRPERAGYEKPWSYSSGSNTRSGEYRRHRDAVLARDGWVCQICSMAIDPAAASHDDLSLALDHVIQVAEGGSGDLENLRASHRWCNTARENYFLYPGDESVRRTALQRFAR